MTLADLRCCDVGEQVSAKNQTHPQSTRKTITHLLFRPTELLLLYWRRSSRSSDRRMRKQLRNDDCHLFGELLGVDDV